MNIFPAIDIIEGKCVRLSKGVLSNKTIYENSPVEMAKIYQDAGFNTIHVVDLDATLGCLLYTSPSPRDRQKSRMPSSA